MSAVMMVGVHGFDLRPPEKRDGDADALKAVNDQIADREAVGAQATPYLLQQKRELEALIARRKAKR